MKHPYESIEVRCSDYIPSDLEPGLMYVSYKYGTSVHLCPCGCGNKAVTPLDGDHSWTLTVEDKAPTLHSSCANRFECKSHYWIQKGKVVWC